MPKETWQRSIFSQAAISSVFSSTEQCIKDGNAKKDCRTHLANRCDSPFIPLPKQFQMPLYNLILY